jgi:hypothetical protein
MASRHCAVQLAFFQLFWCGNCTMPRSHLMALVALHKLGIITSINPYTFNLVLLGYIPFLVVVFLTCCALHLMNPTETQE